VRREERQAKRIFCSLSPHFLVIAAAPGVLTMRRSSGVKDVRVSEAMETIALRRLGEARPAGLWLVSLPWPRERRTMLRLGDRAPACLPLGQWPGMGEDHPRRQLLIADAGGEPAPDTLTMDRRPSAATAPP